MHCAECLHTFADITEPDVLQRTSALAVDAFQLIYTNDNIAQGRAVLQDEYRAVTACVGISVARPTTVVLFVAHVFRAGDNAWRCERNDRSDACRNIEGLTSSKARRGNDNGNIGTHVGV